MLNPAYESLTEISVSCDLYRQIMSKDDSQPWPTNGLTTDQPRRRRRRHDADYVIGSRDSSRSDDDADIESRSSGDSNDNRSYQSLEHTAEINQFDNKLVWQTILFEFC